jgi:hypothetical protein
MTNHHRQDIHGIYRFEPANTLFEQDRFYENKPELNVSHNNMSTPDNRQYIMAADNVFASCPTPQYLAAHAVAKRFCVDCHCQQVLIYLLHLMVYVLFPHKSYLLHCRMMMVVHSYLLLECTVVIQDTISFFICRLAEIRDLNTLCICN